jgi:hypothetical protein
MVSVQNPANGLGLGQWVSKVDSVPPSAADVAISTKNTFIHVHGQSYNKPGQEYDATYAVTQSAPPVYRYPEPDDLPSTPEVWSVKPMPPVEEEEATTKVVADQNGPFPTLGLDEEPQASITDPTETGSTSTSTNGLSANARPFVPSRKQANGTAAQLTTPHEKACADSLKAALAALFRDTGGVMFMLTRFGPYAFSVRLRMPANADLQDAARQIAYKKNYPSQFHVAETSVADPVVHLTVHYNDGSFGGSNSWDICWDFVKNGECKRASNCRWPHIPGAYFTIALENAPQ